MTDTTREVTSLFDEKAAAWPAKYGSSGVLRSRLQRFSRVLGTYCPPPARVLDFGCGTGELARELSAAGYAVTGMDTSRAMLDAASAADTGQAIKWVLIDGDTPRLSVTVQAYDAIVASSVLEYVPDPGSLLREWNRVLRDGGVVVCTVPDMSHHVRWVESAARAMLFGPARWLCSIAPKRARAYLAYLRVSKNRYGEKRWQLLARAADLIPVEGGDDRRAGRQSLALLVFRKQSML